MKKINFASFFSATKPSPHEHTLYIASIILMSCYLLIIVIMHSMQGYTWYQLRKQKISYAQSLSTFNASLENYAQAQQSKRVVQEKIDFVNQQKRDASTPLLYLKNIYYNPSQPIATMTLKGQQFSLSLHAQTIRIAQEFLKGLKMQPLIRKARIVHMQKDGNHYTVEIKGKLHQQ